MAIYTPEKFKEEVHKLIASGDNPCNLIAYDRKTQEWFVVTELQLDRLSGKPSVVRGFLPGDDDKDGYTACGGTERGYAGGNRYVVYHRESRMIIA